MSDDDYLSKRLRKNIHFKRTDIFDVGLLSEFNFHIGLHLSNQICKIETRPSSNRSQRKKKPKKQRKKSGAIGESTYGKRKTTVKERGFRV